MKRVLKILACAILCLGSAATAQTPVDRFDISINSESEQDQTSIFALANTFAMVAPQTSGQRRASRLEFWSAPGLVQDGVASDKLGAALPELLGLSIARLEAMRTPCDISRHRFSDIDVLIAVHSADAPQPQDAHRCFVAALWIYHAGGTEGVNVDNWRVPYARIIGSLAGGRPAFAGFGAGDN